MALNNEDLSKLKETMSDLWKLRAENQRDIMGIESLLSNVKERNDAIILEIMEIRNAIND